MAKLTTITLETNSLLVLRSRSSTRAWCPRCGADVEMFALQDTGVVSNLSQSEVEEWLNSSELHRSQGPDGAVLICLNSFIGRLQNTTST